MVGLQGQCAVRALGAFILVPAFSFLVLLVFREF